LRRWECLTESAPLLTSPHGSGSLRYIDAQLTGGPGKVKPGTLSVFYEFARADCAHDLRLTTVSVESLLDGQNRVV
jgi:hypothetical protein